MDDVIEVELDHRQMGRQLELVIRELLNNRILGDAVRAVVVLPTPTGGDNRGKLRRLMFWANRVRKPSIDSQVWSVIEELLSHFPSILLEFRIVADFSLVTDSKEVYGEAVDRTSTPLYWVRQSSAEFFRDASRNNIDLVYDLARSGSVDLDGLARIISDNGVAVMLSAQDQITESDGSFEDLGSGVYRRMPRIS